MASSLGQRIDRHALTLAGWYVPGVSRAAIDSRFHALIPAIVNVRSANSFSLKCRRTSS